MTQPTTPVTIESLPPGPDPKRGLWGRGLRFVLVAELMRRPEASVAELVSWLDDQGYRLAGRASKIVSDGLRWEVRRGRIIRLERGRYRYHRAPASTARRIRVFAQFCRAWIVAITLHEPPPPSPPDPRSDSPGARPRDPIAAPWNNMAWLWGT